mmetsp:Transcript_25936/g.74205  ORF Transcript_25936/g.74205 Transcript_25936/m.74205 type:complete len:280 (-) Transcript_25936:1345-2184(-)
MQSLDCICTTTMWSLCSTISLVCRLVEVALVPGPTLSGFWESVLSCRSRWSIAWRKARRRCCVPASSVWVCIGRCPIRTWRCSSLLSVGSPTTAGSCWPPTPLTGKQASGSTGWMFPSAGACGSQTCTSLLLPLLHRRRRRWPQRPSLDSRRGWALVMARHPKPCASPKTCSLPQVPPSKKHTAVRRWPSHSPSGLCSMPTMLTCSGLHCPPTLHSLSNPRSPTGLSSSRRVSPCSLRTSRLDLSTLYSMHRRSKFAAPRIRAVRCMRRPTRHGINCRI